MDDIIKKARLENEQNKENIIHSRKMIKSNERLNYSDQLLGKPVPPAFKPIKKGVELFDLPDPPKVQILKDGIFTLISERQTCRNFGSDSLTINELSWLLWATQEIRKTIPEENRVFQTVPSGGDRHPFETYLAVNNVVGMEPGLYRYIGKKHQLMSIALKNDLGGILTEIPWGQRYAGNCAVCFIWSVVPERTEWRYAGQAKKNILIESGHIGQNLYLASEAVNCGTCGIAAYDQNKIDDLLNLNGTDEFVVYIMPVGRIPN